MKEIDDSGHTVRLELSNGTGFILTILKKLWIQGTKWELICSNLKNL